MQILVTGGGGFLGFEIIKQLINRGHQVKSFSRNRYDKLEQLGIKQVQGNILDKSSINNALEGCDAIIHTASLVKMWGKWDDFYQTNYVGTKNLIEAAKEAGISKFVYTSSPSVIFGNTDLENINEDHPYPNKFYGLYARSKALAEQFVLQSKDDNFAVTSLRPHLIFGKHDPHMIPRLIEKAKQGKLRIIGSGENKVDIIHVQNAAYAHVLAVEGIDINHKMNGQAYFLGQERPVKLWQFINTILSFNNAPEVTKRISPALGYFIGAVCEFAFKLKGEFVQDPPMTRFVAMQLSKNHYYDHQRAFDDIGNYIKLNIDDAILSLR